MLNDISKLCGFGAECPIACSDGGLARYSLIMIGWGQNEIAVLTCVSGLSRDMRMISDEVSRRTFLKGSGTFIGSTMLRAAATSFLAVSQAVCSARDEGAAFENITNAEAREFIAVAARILPTTDTPGATEAGAVYFVDKAFGTFLADSLGFARAQHAGFQAGVADAYPGAQRFSDLDEADQDAYLKTTEQTPFFQGARFLTIAGVFGMASYGGNRDNIGWKLVGMDGPPTTSPPPPATTKSDHIGTTSGPHRDTHKYFSGHPLFRKNQTPPLFCPGLSIRYASYLGEMSCDPDQIDERYP